MSETNESTSTGDVSKNESERTKQVTVVGWTAGMSALFAMIALANEPTWPVAFGMAAVAAMVAGVCYFILKQ